MELGRDQRHYCIRVRFAVPPRLESPTPSSASPLSQVSPPGQSDSHPLPCPATIRTIEGHAQPRLLFDAVQMPINPFDPSFRSFERDMLPVAVSKGMAVFSVKSMGGAREPGRIQAAQRAADSRAGRA